MKTDRHSFSKEISALIAQMTLEEKLDQIDQDLMGIDWEKSPSRTGATAANGSNAGKGMPAATTSCKNMRRSRPGSASLS